MSGVGAGAKVLELMSYFKKSRAALSLNWLGRYKLFFKIFKSGLNEGALPGQGYDFIPISPRAEVIPLLFKGLAEPTGRFELFEAAHRIITLLDTSMIL